MKVAFTVCGIGILTVIIVAIVREIHESYVKWITLVSVLICLGIIVSSIGEAVSVIKEITSHASNTYTEAVLKALGITVLTGAAYEICHSLGEVNISRCIEAVGKIEILLLSVPLFRELISLIIL